MWPKALGQLVELAPHITRLVPLADRFLKDKSSTEDSLRQLVEGQRTFVEAQRAAATDLSDRLHADLGAITSAQSSQAITVQRQIGELEKHLGTARADALAARTAAEGLNGQLGRIESMHRSVRTLMLVTVALLVVVLVSMATLLLRVH